MSKDITFRLLAEDDLPLLHRWLNNPDVARWYGLGIENKTFPTAEEVRENYLPRIRGEFPTLCYIMCSGERAFGFVQCYRTGDYPEYAEMINVDPDAWGIDIFIGEDGFRGRGFGTEALGLFVEQVIFSRPGVQTAIIAPNPENRRAIRSYEKAGFMHSHTVWVEMEGEYEYVMVRRAPGTFAASLGPPG
jgi:RimJ/RimL family protein N-acetyltransferase